ncbi:MAG: hypothetical protein ABSD62_01290 [Candidatus Limnocylindrales bacterium]|jgi:hypothetical protein
MSKRHQASRRRTYGRRQHELHERTDRLVGVMDWLGESTLPDTKQRWITEPAVRWAAGDGLQLQRID